MQIITGENKGSTFLKSTLLSNLFKREKSIFEDYDCHAPELTKDRPFRGLVSYQDRPEDHKLFGGREKDIDALHELVLHSTLVTFYGFSGTGKTSVLNAGLIPKLRETNFIPIYIRLDFDSKISLTSQVKGIIISNDDWKTYYNKTFKIPVEAIEVGKFDSSFTEQYNAPFETTPDVSGSLEQETLWEYFTKFSNEKSDITPLLIFDQFEEIFTLATRSKHIKQGELEELINELKYLIENQIPPKCKNRIEANPDFNFSSRQNFRVMFSLREDYLPKLNRLKDKIYSLDKAKYGLNDLDRFQAVKIIDKIQKHFDVSYLGEKSLTLILDYLENLTREKANFIEPLSLSLLLYQLNEIRISKGLREAPISWMTKSFLDKLMGDYYCDSMEKYRRKVRKVIENYLINDTGNRLPIPESTLLEKGLEKEEIGSLVYETRILRYEKRLGNKSVEIVHDSLVKGILDAKRRRDFRIRALRNGSILVTLLICLFVALVLVRQTVILEREASILTEVSYLKAEAFKKASDQALESAKKSEKMLENQINKNEAIKKEYEKNLKELESRQIQLDSAGEKINVQKDSINVQRDSISNLYNVAKDLNNAAKFERTRYLKLSASNFINQIPKDHKRAFLYAYAAYLLNEEDTDLRTSLKDIYNETSFYKVKRDKTNNTFFLQNGENIDINKKLLSNFDTSENKNSTFYQSNITARWPAFETIDSTGNQFYFGISESKEYMYAYNDRSKSLRFWKVEDATTKEIFNLTNVTKPVFSKNEKYISYYEIKASAFTNSSFVILSLEKPEELLRMKPERMYVVSDFNYSRQSSNYYVLEHSRGNNFGQKKILVGNENGKSIVIGEDISETILAMDFIPSNKLIYLYTYNACYTYNLAGEFIFRNPFQKTKSIKTTYDKKRNEIILVSDSDIIILDSLGKTLSSRRFEYTGKDLTIKIQNEKLLIVNKFELFLFDLNDLKTPYKTLSLKENIIDADFLLGKYIYIKTRSYYYTWHFKRRNDFTSLEEILSDFSNDQRQYSEFWVKDQFDANVLKLD